MKARMKAALAGILLFCLGIPLGAAIRQKTAVYADGGSELFLPGSYEQYLNLSSPADAVFCDGYFAVADGNRLFVFDRENRRYLSYEHKTSGGENLNISKLQFTFDGRLFFSDQDAHLYLYDVSENQARIQNNITCSTFVMEGNTLYTTAVVSGMTTFSAYPYLGGGMLGDTVKRVAQVSGSTNTTPCMFVYQGSLYCATNNYIRAYTQKDGTYEASEHLFSKDDPVSELSSVCVMDGEIYYTVNGPYSSDSDGLYRAHLDGNSEHLIVESGFRALTSYGGALYCVAGSSVREYRFGEEGISATGYEIGAGSSSFNRLSDAGETVRAGDLVVTADGGNERVSVYDVRENSFTILPCGKAEKVATDGELIAAAVGEHIYLYRKGQTDPYYTHTVNAASVTGLAVVYGRCYFVTATNFGEAAENGVSIVRSLSPTALTSDVYGNLYVADMANNVTKFSEAEFLNSDAMGVPANSGWVLPAGASSLRADYEGNLYYLSEGGIFRNGARLGNGRSEGMVFSPRSELPVSLALGFEDNGIYLQYGDYMVYSTALDIPNLSEISAEGAYEKITQVPSREELALVDVPAGTTGISVDLTQLREDSVCFPYAGYSRTEGGRGILLFSAENFSLVALYDEFSYRVTLFPAEACTPAPLIWEDVTPAKRYCTNEIGLVRYPCICAPLMMARLPRGTEVTLLSQVRAEDGWGFDFAFVETKEGEKGYLPLGYLTANVPFDGENSTFTLGYLKANADGVTFLSEDGDSLVVTERTRVKIYDGGDGRVVVRMTYMGEEFTARVTRSMIETGNPNALRMSVIVILCVVAVGILAAYAVFVPKKKRKK